MPKFARTTDAYARNVATLNDLDPKTGKPGKAIPVDDPYSNLQEPDVLSLASGAVSVDRRKCNPISGQALVCNYAYGKRGWLGIASIWADGSKHITQATTKLNDSYYGSGSSYNTPAWRAMVAR